MDGIVIIGGSAEAYALSRALPKATVVLASPERVARDWARPPVLGLDALRGARRVIEAAHPCDARTAWQVARLCSAEGIARLQLVRPPWRAGRRDRWWCLRRPQEARTVLPRGARVLVATGRQMLPHLRGCRAHLLVRRLGPPPRFGLRVGRFLPDEGPFSVAEEYRVLRANRIDWLLLQNAGGQGGWPKLEAARRLGLPVAMLDRPPRPGGPRVATVEGALAWLND